MKALSASLAASSSSPTALDRAAGRLLARALTGTRTRLTLWDGEVVGDVGGDIVVQVCDRATLLALLVHPSWELGERYRLGRLRVEGDLTALLVSMFARAWDKPRSRSASSSIVDYLRRVTPRRARANAAHHYDLGARFYGLWLDERMVYTCAWFRDDDASLEDAQLAKLDLVCRKLDLRAGETVVELGSGWGALALHMAGQYGVRVRAFNVNAEQVSWSRESAARAGLADRVEFVEEDYRSATGRYDAVVSVGMLEHVGVRDYRRFGALVAGLLAPAGRALVHTVGRHRPLATNAWIRRRIFPGGHAPSLGEMRRIFEPNDLAILDIENLRTHYALTLKHWLSRFRARREIVAEAAGEEFARTWELYLAASQASFETGWSQLYQVVCAPARSNAIPARIDAIRRPGVPS